MILDLLAILFTIFLFHLFVWPFIKGFYDGYRDSRRGQPYDDKSDKQEN